MGYVEGGLTKRSPAVTFGKGGRRPPQNGNPAVEESPFIREDRLATQVGQVKQTG